ncbi:MAG: 3'-5' exonuclease, partial [Bauldia sp.]|nr:3'-5' exonuclease [Bauldia sp.]
MRRAQEWRWEPPRSAEPAADDEGQRRWAEARAKAITWAVEVVADPRTVYLDTETTGFGPRAEIVDIAVVDGAGEVLLDSLVQPERRIPREVTAIHGISDADVRSAPRWSDLYTEVLHVLQGRRIVVYNVVFDRQMVRQAC